MEEIKSRMIDLSRRFDDHDRETERFHMLYQEHTKRQAEALDDIRGSLKIIAGQAQKPLNGQLLKLGGMLVLGMFAAAAGGEAAAANVAAFVKAFLTP